MRHRFFLILALAAFVALVLPREARAVDDPDIEWWTYETDHFKVTYPAQVDPIAKRVARLCETIHLRLTEEMQFAPDTKTEILLTDDTDSANGLATPVPYNNIRLFVTAPPDLSTLGDYDDWMLGLVTHEYTHILHTGNISGLAAIGNYIIGRTLAPNSAQPRWVLEGLAVVEESEHTSAGRIRSSLFDMWLRADVLEDYFARLDQISSDAQRWPYGNLVYLYGSRFLRWIEDVYGPNTMPAVSADYGATTIPFGINRAIRRVTGATYEDLYDGWHAQLKKHYQDQVDAVDKVGRIEGARITFHGQSVEYPRFATPEARIHPDEDELFYFLDDSNDPAGIYRFTLGDPTKAGKRDEQLIAHTSTDGAVGFMPDGGLIFTDLAVYRNLYDWHDLFSLPKGVRSTLGTESDRKQLTNGLRALEPDVSPTGRQVAFTVNSRSTTFLQIADLHPDGTLGPRRTLVPSDRFDQAYTPRFSPDGSKIAWSAWRAGGYRDIRIVDVETGKVEDVTHDRSLDMQPAWAPDGKTLYFSSDRTGIFNIYAYDLSTKKFSLVTNVHGGAIEPAISPDGKTLVYVGYTHEGYDLFAMRLDPAKFLPAPDAPEDRPEPEPEPDAVKIQRHRYNPLPTFGPHTWSASIGTGNYGSTAFTISTSASDLVGHHNASASITLEPSAPGPQVSLDYSYSGFPVNLGAGFSRSIVPRKSSFRISNTVIPFDETLTGAYASVSLPMRNLYVDQSIGLTMSVNQSTTKLTIPQALDPQATQTVLPTEGTLSQLRADYSLSTIENGTSQAGPARGVALHIDASFAGPETLSDFTYYQFDGSLVGYIPMPWPGYQTLALRAEGGVSAGNYSRRGNYFVGGYDLANSSLFDQLLKGSLNGAFVIRGYEPGEFSGSEFLLTTIEYRAPIWVPNWGPSTFPIFWKRLDAAAFVDYGGAFDNLQLSRTQLFRAGDLIYQPDLHCSVGGELWFSLTALNRIGVTLRAGYAYGFSSTQHKNGQAYFLAASSF